MLFLINWQCSDQSEDVIKRRLELIGHWERPDGWETHGSYARVDGSGGTIVVEAGSAETVARGLTKLLPYFDFDVTPVLEVGEWRSITHTGIAFRDSVPESASTALPADGSGRQPRR